MYACRSGAANLAQPTGEGRRSAGYDTADPLCGCLPPPPINNGPCVTGNWVVAAVRVKVGGMPVLLRDSVAVCVPTGTGLNVIMTQVRVKGM